MAYVVQDVARVRGFVEVVNSFAVEGAIGSFFDLPIIEGSGKLTLNDPMETPGLLQQHMDGYPSKVRMPRTATYDFAMNLTGLDARATGLAVANALAKLFKIGMGGQQIQTGTTINDAVASATTFIVASATGLEEGGGIVLGTGAGGALEFREIKTKSSNTITLKHALTSAPANSSVVYAAITHFLDNATSGTVQSLQVAYEGLDDNDRFLLRGGQWASDPVFDTTPGGLPKVTFSWMFADWDYADGVNTTMNLTSAAISDQAYADTGIQALMDSELRLYTQGTTSLTSTLIHAPEFKFQPHIKYTAHRSPSGVNNVVQWIRTRMVPAVTGEFIVPFDAQTFFTMQTAEHAKDACLQIGSTVTNGGLGLSAPAVHLDSVQREGIDGIAGQRCTFYGRLDGTTTTNSTNLQKSVVRIHMY